MTTISPAADRQIRTRLGVISRSARHATPNASIRNTSEVFKTSEV